MLSQLGAKQTLLPRDVATRWNSTLDMLEYALSHKEAVDRVTQSRDGGLRMYELSKDEWVILGQLRNVLKVRCRRGTDDIITH